MACRLRRLLITTARPCFRSQRPISAAAAPGTLTDCETVAITITAVADITADSVSTNEDTAITFNAITGTNGATADTFENAGRAITSVTQGANGSVTFLANGSISYTPNADFNGTDSFSYTVTSGGVTETVTVSVTVIAVNDAPVNTAPGAASTAEDATLAFTGASLISVGDVDAASLTVTLTVSNGTLTLGSLAGLTFTTGDGTSDATMTVSGSKAALNAALATLTFAPTADYNGAATLTVLTSDGSLTDSDTVAITITAVADITADSVSTSEDTAITFNAITGTNGATADTFENAGRAITSVTQGANGSVTFLANGSISYTPNADFNGTDSFSYTVTSGGVTETVTVSVTVIAVNDAPVNTAPGAASTAEDATLAFTGASLISVGDVDAASLTVTLTVSNGTLTLGSLAGLTFTTGDGTSDASMTFSGSKAALNAALATLTFAPTADYNGAATLTVLTSDGSLTDSDTVAITITAVADITADSVSTSEDTAITFNAITGTMVQRLTRSRTPGARSPR